MPVSVTSTSISAGPQIRANARRPTFELSATMMTLRAWRPMSWLMLASPSWWAVAPATGSIPSTPRIATSRVTCSSTPVASGPVSS
jgi:hypothetical protein